MERNMHEKQRRQSTLGAALTNIQARVSALTHDIIDPYVTICLSTSGITRTTKPVRDGGNTCQWTSEHDHELIFDYPFEPQQWSCTPAEQQIQDDHRNVPGKLSVQVFDQDLIMDAHIGGAEMAIGDLLEGIAQRTNMVDNSFRFGGAGGSFDFCLPGGKHVCLPIAAEEVNDNFDAPKASKKGNTNITANGLVSASLEREITLRRRHNNNVSGFLSLSVRFVKEGAHCRADGSSYDVGKLIVTVNSASDLWDPSDPSDWIPDDPHTGSSLCSSLVVTLLYFGIGAVFYCSAEGWTLVDALYFAVVTFTTVGYGDVKPLLVSSKLFTCLYMIVGISMVAISIIRLCLAAYDCVMAFCSQFHGCHEHVKHRCLHKKDARQKLNRVASHRRVMTRVLPGDRESGGNNFRNQNGSGSTEDADEDNNDPNSIRAMIMRMLLTVILLVAVGTIFFVAVEGMTFVDACYMSAATVTTVGYGDIAPATQVGRLFAVFWITLSYAMLARSLHHVVDGFHELSLKTQRLKVLNRDLSRSSIINMDKDGDGKLSRLEFLSHMVVKLKLCRESQLDKIMERFDEIEQSRIARERVMHHVATGSDANFDEVAAIKAAARDHNNKSGDSKTKRVKDDANNTFDVAEKSTLSRAEPPLAGMLAHLRMAADYGRKHVETEAQMGRVNEAKTAVHSYRMILELLHKQEQLHVQRLHTRGQKWTVPPSPPLSVRVG